ncbi:MAG: FtsQ-type POTRA domain-containing protein [Chthoniobacteraceae bacterium]|jgi:cell division septal protein FtsQ
MKAKAKTPGNRRVTSRKQRKQQHLLDVKVRSRAATRQRNRSLLAFLSGALLFCAAIGGVWYGGRAALRKYFWQNPEYNLAEVEIHTDGPLTRQQVLEATGIQEGGNIFRINLSNARRGLLALPQVDRADIERTLPNKISIDITERKPVAWVTGAENSDPGADPGAFLIDRDGTLLRVKDQVPGYYHLPVICGLPVENYEEGQTVDLPEVAAALQLIRLADENPARYQVRSIDVSKGYCLIVTDDRRAKVTFPLDDVQAQLDRLGLVLANADGDGREIQTVNLLVQRNIPVTFVPPPEPAADDADASPSPAIPEASPAAAPAVKHAHKTHHAAITVRRATPVFPTGGGE